MLPAQTVLAAAEEYRQCTSGEECQIGEYLFDDSYQPITSATCNLTSHDPSNAVFLNAQAMSTQSDGWNYHSFSTTGLALGLYRTTMCCTYQTEYLCTDKTFEVVTSPSGLSASQVTNAVWDAPRADHTTTGTFGENLQNPSSISAADIWSYPNRSLSSFGTLVADIWSYSNRSLNDFGALVANIWSRDDRTLTSANLSSGSLATKSDVNVTVTTENSETAATTTEINTKVDSIASELANQTYLLEKLVNAPIVETLIEENTPPPQDLLSKIRRTKTIAAQLSQGTSQLQTHLASINSNWDTSTYQLALNELSSTTRVLGASTDWNEETTEPETINGQIAWLKKQWNSPVLTELATQATAALTNTDNISREIRTYGKTLISQEYLGITNQHLDKLQTLIGQPEEIDPSHATLYGLIHDLELKNDTITQLLIEVRDLHETWETHSSPVRTAMLTSIKDRVLDVNQIPNIEPLLSARRDDENAQKNLALALEGILNSNYTLLSQQADQYLSVTWLEQGSIIFRSLATNPSNTIAQTVPIKYVLPPELKVEHIIKKEDWLTISYNQEKNALMAVGEISLQPNETKTFSIEVVDVWVIPDEEVASLRKQVTALFEPLKNTSYFAQGSTIKADIEVNLDKIDLLQKNTQTPEAKIRAHREAMIELNAAKAKLDDLKVLVASAGSVGTVFGFVGGVQTIAVWGMIIILVAGFVFLALYMKVIGQNGTNSHAKPKKTSPDTKKPIKTTSTEPLKIDRSGKKDLSLFGLIKEIILLSTAKPSKSHRSKAMRPLIFMVTAILGLILGLSFIVWFAGTANSDLLSPVHQPEVPAPQPFTTPMIVASPEPDSTTPFVFTPSKMNEQSELAQPKTTTPAAQDHLTVNVLVDSQHPAVAVRDLPSPEGRILSRIWVTKKVRILDQVGDWVQIQVVSTESETLKGWIPQTALVTNDE